MHNTVDWWYFGAPVQLVGAYRDQWEREMKRAKRSAELDKAMRAVLLDKGPDRDRVIESIKDPVLKEWAKKQ